MAKTECCSTCVYAYRDPQHVMAAFASHFTVALRPSCANHPESYGRMRPVCGSGICRNYRPKSKAPGGDVRQIPVGDGCYAYVDAADYEWLSQWTWHLQNGYAVRRKKRKTIYMHREIMQTPQGMIVDHKNRNKLDNTRDNLRNCTYAENTANQTRRRGTSSRFLGVSYKKDHKKWCAQFPQNGRSRCIGYFTDEVDAARAYDRRAVEMLGAAARLNFPEEWPPERIREVHAQGQTKT